MSKMGHKEYKMLEREMNLLKREYIELLKESDSDERLREIEQLVGDEICNDWACENEIKMGIN